MAMMKTLMTEIENCEQCYGQGWHFWAQGEDFDTESCDCNPHQLFITKEND